MKHTLKRLRVLLMLEGDKKLIEEILFLRKELDRKAKERIELVEELTLEANKIHEPTDLIINRLANEWNDLKTDNSNLNDLITFVMSKSFNQGITRAIEIIRGRNK